jgi:hypothetical protein
MSKPTHRAQQIHRGFAAIDELRAVLQFFEDNPPGKLSPDVLMDFEAEITKAEDKLGVIRRYCGASERPRKKHQGEPNKEPSHAL